MRNLSAFDDYMERCDVFMVANAINEGKKTNLLLALVGAETSKR